MFVTAQNWIFVADLEDDLNFTAIPSTERPGHFIYDCVEKKIYWNDYKEDRVYRADEHGENREEVTFGNGKGMV